MANINISRLLRSSKFVNNVILIKRNVVLNSRGETTIVEDAPINTVASVQPTNGKTIERLPEELRAKDVKTFYIQASLQGSNYPPIIVFNGDRYQVQFYDDWGNFSKNWINATCVKEDFI